GLAGGGVWGGGVGQGGAEASGRARGTVAPAPARWERARRPGQSRAGREARRLGAGGQRRLLTGGLSRPSPARPPQDAPRSRSAGWRGRAAARAPDDSASPSPDPSARVP